jgi:hypothetical protein
MCVIGPLPLFTNFSCPLFDTDIQTFELTLTSQDVTSAISRGKIASLLGVEGFVPNAVSRAIILPCLF